MEVGPHSKLIAVVVRGPSFQCSKAGARSAVVVLMVNTTCHDFFMPRKQSGSRQCLFLELNSQCPEDVGRFYALYDENFD